MSLLQSTVSLGPDVLVSAQAGKRDFTQAVAAVLQRIPPGDSKLTYVVDQFLIHYVAEDGVVYLVLAEDSVGRRMPFSFLADLKRKFTAFHPPGSLAPSDAPALARDFGPDLEALMRTYAEAPPPDALRQAQKDIGDVKEIMVNNIDAILSRGERIDLLVDKTDQLAGAAWQFKRGAKQVRRRMWWKNTRIVALSGFVGVILLWLLVAQFCGLSLAHCRPKPDERSDGA